MSESLREAAAMRRALELAASGPCTGPNPRVGAVLLGPDGRVLGEGLHRGAGTAHAEVEALEAAAAGGDGTAPGATVVVTLEPCNHTGRTGPCTQALLDAGVSRVVFAQSDPNPKAAGGADTLRRAGVEVVGGLLEPDARALNPFWTFAVSHGRPFVTWKFAASIDGRVAAADGTSRWITSEPARADVHRLRSEVDAVMVGTGTVLADDPQLTARPDGPEHAASGPERQPLRVVVGERAVPESARVLDRNAETVLIRKRDPWAVLAALQDLELRHVLLEGGPTLAGAFVRAGLIDEVVAYLAPVLLGAGRGAVDDVGITTLASALRMQTRDVSRFGPDVRITMRVSREEED